MSKQRAGIFDDDEIDVSGFVPRTAPASTIPPERVRAVSEGASFRSREPAAPPTQNRSEVTRREPRRHRTGRNVQLNIKARAETIESFYAIADREGWVLGEAFEHAVQALERERPAGK